MIFDNAELGQTIDDEEYDRIEPDLRERLLELQFDCHESGIPTLLIIAGVPGAGRGTAVEHLLHWLDARRVSVHTARLPVEVERERPLFYRYWQRVPSRGRLAILLGGWVRDALDRRLAGEMDDHEWDLRLRRITEFETQLHRDGIRILKVWLHLSADAQKAELARRMDDPSERWQLSLEDWAGAGRYARHRELAAEYIHRTQTPEAPWHIVEAADPHYRVVTVARHLGNVMTSALAEDPPPAGKPNATPLSTPNALDRLDLSLSLKRKEYRAALEHWKGRLRLLVRLVQRERRSAILVFEGSDAAGKGGAIRRLTDAMDPRTYDVHAISAPTKEEHDHPWLWRFWTRLPRRGRIAIFDRSWYGRVLVERVEGFAHHSDWQRAWAEIRSFEEQLDQSGFAVIKFWLQIDQDEQLARFNAREETGYKRYKLTDEDWRNRDRWDNYSTAACEMIERTSRPDAPWVLVEANDKQWARVKVIRHVCAHLARSMGIDLASLPGADPKIEAIGAE